MKNLLMTLLLFALVSTAKSQEAFVLGKSYPIGWVVFYPANTFWITKTATVAKTYPVEGTAWTRYYYPTPPVPASVPVSSVPVVATIRQSAFDSLLIKCDSIAIKLKNIEANQQSSTIKVYQTGASLLKVLDDHTVIVKSLLPADGYDFQMTDSTIKPIKRP